MYVVNLDPTVMTLPFESQHDVCDMVRYKKFTDWLVAAPIFTVDADTTLGTVVVDILSVQQLSYSGHMRRLGKGIHSNDLRRKRFIMYICTGTSVRLDHEAVSYSAICRQGNNTIEEIPKVVARLMHQLGDYVPQCDDPLSVPFVIYDVDSVNLLRVQLQYNVLDRIILFASDHIVQKG